MSQEDNSLSAWNPAIPISRWNTRLPYRPWLSLAPTPPHLREPEWRDVAGDAEGLVAALERLKAIVDERAADTESAAAVLLECQARASGLTAIFRRLLKLSEGEKDFEKNFRASHQHGILHL